MSERIAASSAAKQAADPKYGFHSIFFQRKKEKKGLIKFDVRQFLTFQITLTMYSILANFEY